MDVVLGQHLRAKALQGLQSSFVVDGTHDHGAAELAVYVRHAHQRVKVQSAWPTPWAHLDLRKRPVKRNDDAGIDKPIPERTR